jgi:predicted DCC family thiol-disulfide oxidoreductase YuxK
VISLKDIARCWNRFFFEPESPLPIAVYRIFFGLAVLANHALLLPDVGEWFGARAILSFATGGRLAGGEGLSLFAWLPHTDAWVWTIFLVSCAAAFTLTLGLLTRASSIVLFVTLLTLHHRNPLILNSGDTFFRLAGFFLMFSQAGAALSIDRLIRIARGKESGPPVARAPWAMRMIQLQLSFLYLYAFVWKAMGGMWLSGTAVYYTSRIAEFWRFPLPYVFEHLWTIKLWTWATLLVELALGTLVWVKELRYWVLLAGLLLHLGIEYTMNIQLFAFIITGAYVTFVEPAHLERAFAWVRRKWNSATRFSQPVPVLYDGNCSFCIRSLEVVKRLDVLGRIDFHNMHDRQTMEQFPDFDTARGEKEMLVRTENGWLGGFFAFRFLAKHLPLLWLVRPLLYLGPVRAAGDRIYQRIAARRYCILKPDQYAADRVT